MHHIEGLPTLRAQVLSDIEICFTPQVASVTNRLSLQEWV